MKAGLGGSTITIEELAIRVLLALVFGLCLVWIANSAVYRRDCGPMLCVHKSAVITIATLDRYLNVRAHGGGADPLRVIQGLAHAIGFIAAGGIFVDRGRVRNLTTAANVWLTAGVGIAASSSLCATGALFTDRDLKLSINFMPNAVYEPSACIQKSLAAAKRANFPSFRNRAVTRPTSNTGTL